MAQTIAISTDGLAEQIEFTNVVFNDVLTERVRQIQQEGWSPSHDDKHDKGELAGAAIAYAIAGQFEENTALAEFEKSRFNRIWSECRSFWPWSLGWWKPKDRRRNLIRATALLIAEIERLDRTAAKAGIPR